MSFESTSPDAIRSRLVVVSSGGLRRQILRDAVRKGTGLGLRVVTPWTLAQEILERYDVVRGDGSAVVRLLVRRHVEDDVLLSESLGRFRDADGLVAAAVSDLTGAGLDAEGVPDVLQALSEPGVDDRGLARTTVRIAGDVATRLRELELERMAERLARAVSVLEERGASLFAGTTVTVFGFADATGTARRFLDALLALPDARMMVLRPADPAEEGEDRGAAFLDRFTRRLRPEADVRVASPRSDIDRASTDAPIRLFAAAGIDAEVSEIAARIRRLLDDGTAPETIAVVARGSEARAHELRRIFATHGVPFSGLDVPAAGLPQARRFHAALDVFRRRADVATERWIAAWGARFGEVESSADGAGDASGALLVHDLRLALRACGAGRLRDVAELDVDTLLAGRNSFALPVRRGLAAGGGSTEEGGDDAADVLELPRTAVAEHRRVSRSRLESVVGQAHSLLATLDTWPEFASGVDHDVRWRGWLEDELGWSPDDAAAAALPDLPPDFELRRDEIPRLAESVAVDALRRPLGGVGGGVQVLDVAQARFLEFDHLFLCGLNRDVFPAAAPEDVVLRDSIREHLRPLLPDLALARWRRDEERYLFALLMACSRQITLSWLAADEEGRGLAASPFVERLRRARNLDVAIVGREDPSASKETSAPKSMNVPADEMPRSLPRPILDVLRDLGREDRRDDSGTLWTWARAEAAGRRWPDGADDAGRAMAEVLEEVDPRGKASRGRLRLLSPWHGIVGATRDAADPRRAPLYVTTLESVARCPWRTFLTRLLRLEPVPDPLEVMPDIDMLMLGNTVHTALETLVKTALSTESMRSAADEDDDLRRALERGPIAIAKPASDAVAAALTHAAEDVMRSSGYRLLGLRHALERRARPYVEAAIERDWATGVEIHVVGCELSGTLAPQPGVRDREIRFRADRVDVADTRVRLVDYKTGKPFALGKKNEETRRKHHRKGIAEGIRLQAMCYAASLSATGTVGEGVYAWLKPDLEDNEVETSVAAEEAELRAVFEIATSELLGAFEGGAFTPRLTDAKGVENSACRFCEVTTACVRGDSGARRRWSEVVEAKWADRADEPSSPIPASRVARLWRLHDAVEEAMERRSEATTRSKIDGVDDKRGDPS